MSHGSNKNNNETPSACIYCEHATIISDDANVLCGLKGIVNREYKCRKYVYDPLKRVPRTPPQLPKLSEDDLLL